MAIKSISELHRGRITVDLTGPQGNAFCLLGLAQNLAKQTGKDYEDIQKRMKAGDYENLINVFDSEFGQLVELYR